MFLKVLRVYKQVKQFLITVLGILAIITGCFFGLNIGITLAAEVAPVSSPMMTLLDDSAQNSPSLDTSTIPFEKLNQFVQAYLEVLEFIESRQEDLQKAKTSGEFQHLETEIQTQALAMIEKAGLTQAEYLQLLSLANTDPEFGERVAMQLQEAQ